MNNQGIAKKLTPRARAVDALLENPDELDQLLMDWQTGKLTAAQYAARVNQLVDAEEVAQLQRPSREERDAIEGDYLRKAEQEARSA